MFEAISEKGSGLVNEDIFGYAGGRFWVLDGATPVTDMRFYCSDSDAAFLVKRFSKEMEALSGKNMSNREFLTEAMRNVKVGLDKISIKPELSPSFAMALVDITNDVINIDCLSDCSVIVMRHDDDKVDIYTDRRIEKISARTQRVKDFVNSRHDSISPECGKEIIKRQIIKNRHVMNKKGGFWVGTLDGVAFENTLSWCINKHSVDEILICTDGFFRLFQYNIISIKDFFANKILLTEALKLLRKYEKTMPDNKEYKRSDDATAIKIIAAHGLYGGLQCKL